MTWVAPSLTTSNRASDVPTAFNTAMTALAAHINNNVIHIGAEDVGLLSARPAAGNGGAMYFATDNETLYVDTGSAWKAAISLDALNEFVASKGVAGGIAGLDAAGSVDEHVTPILMDVNADQLELDYAPTSYTPRTSPATNAANQVGSHHAGIDDALAAIFARLAAHGI